MNTQAKFESATLTPDRLVAGNAHLLASRKITLLAGQNLTRGAVLGKITLGAATAAAKAGGNTGDGTITLDATTPIRPGAKVGVYTVRCIAAATNSGTFRVTDPDGFVLGDTTITGGAGGTAAFDNDIKFVLTDAGTDFAAGDGFDVTIAAGSGKYVQALAAAIDGSAVPDLILAEDCNATAGDKTPLAYSRGDFNQNALAIGTGHTVASITETLRTKGIVLLPATPA